MVTGVNCLYSVNGSVRHIGIYKRGHYYGFPDDNKRLTLTSVEHCVADLSRTGYTLAEGTTTITLTNRLFPDK